MRLAREASYMSKDPSTQVGCVLAKDRKVVGTGFNGFPGRIQDDFRLDIRELKYPRIIHAEVNAILDAGRDAWGSDMYMYGFGFAPCSNCTITLIQAGVKSVRVCGEPLEERWKDSAAISVDLLKEADVDLEVLYEEQLEW